MVLNKKCDSKCCDLQHFSTSNKECIQRIVLENVLLAFLIEIILAGNRRYFIIFN